MIPIRIPREREWTHDHPITFETAKDFGLPVRSDIPPEFPDLMRLYPQPVRRHATVEHLPERRRSEGFGLDHNQSWPNHAARGIL